VQFLADDKLEGRNTGSEGHRQAAAYVAAEFERLGLAAAGTQGYMQPVKFSTRQIDEPNSKLGIVREGKTVPVELGKQAYFGLRTDPAPAVQAPMVFVGYGLRVPEMQHDDLKGLNLKGKIAVMFSGAPKGWPGPLSAHVQSGDVRWEPLRKMGAIGLITIPRVQTVPWVRASASRLQASMTAISEEAGQQVSITFNPEQADVLFAGSGHTVKELLDLAAAEKPLPKFPLQGELTATIAVKRGEVESPNVAAKLEGAHPKRKNEYIVVSAHLDHLGKMTTFAGDGIFNGALDNASGVAAMLEVARQLKAGRPLERSVLFVAVTGEEKGLQGSRFFARNPTVPAKQLIANCNMDMFMPLHALKFLTMLGIDESTLGDTAREVAKEFNLPVLPDPIPEQRRFIRSDQYSFIRAGIPSLAFKFGYEKGSPEEALQAEWLKSRYHAVSDDLAQPVDIAAAGRFTEYLAALVARTANQPRRPAWKSDSFFKRFAK
jgi:Zn-dependent M28 family amino/carboxypeptidase